MVSDTNMIHIINQFLRVSTDFNVFLSEAEIPVMAKMIEKIFLIVDKINVKLALDL